MKAVSPQLGISADLPRQGIPPRDLGQRSMKCRIENGHAGDAGRPAPGGLDDGQADGVVQGRQLAQVTDRLDHLGRDPRGTDESRASVDDPEADRVDSAGQTLRHRPLGGSDRLATMDVVEVSVCHHHLTGRRLVARGDCQQGVS